MPTPPCSTCRQGCRRYLDKKALMHVLHITPTFFNPASGLANAVQTMCSALHDNSIKITVATVATETQATTTPALQLITAPKTNIPLLAAWLYAPKLKQNIRNTLPEPPDIIHAHGLWLYPQLLARQLADQWQVPLIITTHGMLEPWRMKYKAWKKYPMWWMVDKKNVDAAHTLVATAQTEADNLKKRGLRNRIEVIPPIVELPKIQPPQSKPESAQMQTKTALFLSRIHPGKGLDLLIEAVARIKPENWRFVIAGPDGHCYAKTIKKRIRKLDLTSCFEFKGRVEGEQKWRLLQNADLFILPSHNENFGIVIAEALACGTPVLTTTATPWKDLESNHCGWLCDPTIESLRDKLSKALRTSQRQLKEKGQNGKTWFEKEFNPATTTNKLITLYKVAAASLPSIS